MDRQFSLADASLVAKSGDQIFPRGSADARAVELLCQIFRDLRLGLAGPGVADRSQILDRDSISIDLRRIQHVLEQFVGFLRVEPQLVELSGDRQVNKVAGIVFLGFPLAELKGIAELVGFFRVQIVSRQSQARIKPLLVIVLLVGKLCFDVPKSGFGVPGE